MLCGWAFLSPLSKQLGWAPGPVSSSSDGARGWILWPALAIMTAESILSVSFVAAQALRPFLARTAERAKSGHLFVRAERDALDSDDDEDDEDDDDEEDARSVEGLRVGGGAAGAARKVAREDEEPSTPVVVIGAVLSCISCVLFVSAVFGEDGIKWWATVIALILASIFAILGCAAFNSLPSASESEVTDAGRILQSPRTRHDRLEPGFRDRQDLATRLCRRAARKRRCESRRWRYR